MEGKTDKNHRENVGVNKIYMKVMAAAKPIYLTVNMKLNATSATGSWRLKALGSKTIKLPHSMYHLYHHYHLI